MGHSAHCLVPLCKAISDLDSWDWVLSKSVLTCSNWTTGSWETEKESFCGGGGWCYEVITERVWFNWGFLIRSFSHQLNPTFSIPQDSAGIRWAFCVLSEIGLMIFSLTITSRRTQYCYFWKRRNNEREAVKVEKKLFRPKIMTTIWKLKCLSIEYGRSKINMSVIWSILKKSM